MWLNLLGFLCKTVFLHPHYYQPITPASKNIFLLLRKVNRLAPPLNVVKFFGFPGQNSPSPSSPLPAYNNCRFWYIKHADFGTFSTISVCFFWKSLTFEPITREKSYIPFWISHNVSFKAKRCKRCKMLQNAETARNAAKFEVWFSCRHYELSF